MHLPILLLALTSHAQPTQQPIGIYFDSSLADAGALTTKAITSSGREVLSADAIEAAATVLLSSGVWDASSTELEAFRLNLGVGELLMVRRLKSQGSDHHVQWKRVSAKGIAGRVVTITGEIAPGLATELRAQLTRQVILSVAPSKQLSNPAKALLQQAESSRGTGHGWLASAISFMTITGPLLGLGIVSVESNSEEAGGAFIAASGTSLVIGIISSVLSYNSYKDEDEYTLRASLLEAPPAPSAPHKAQSAKATRGCSGILCAPVY